MKAADVSLMEVRLGRGLGGKSFIVLTGEVAAVRAAVDAAHGLEEVAGLMNDSVVIPAPHPGHDPGAVLIRVFGGPVRPLEIAERVHTIDFI